MQRLLLMIFCLCLTTGQPWAAPKAETAVISGWVRVALEDAKGKVLSIEIMVGEAEEPYRVVGSKEKELRTLIGEWVVASGLVSEDALGWKSIDVKSYTKEDDLPEPTNPTPPAPTP
jgi:hypothetical protein